MPAAEFVHLHLHTQYSLLDGACRVDLLMDRAAEMGFRSLAMTDHGNLFGAIDFYQRAKKRGIKPIIGCEVYVATGSRRDRTVSRGGGSAYNHLVLLAKDYTGYLNLAKLVSKGYLEGFYYKPRVDKELLAQHSEGLICTSACLKGEVAESLLYKSEDAALRAAGEHCDIFGKENYYLELQDHTLQPQRQVNPGILALARRMGIPLICSNDVHYLTRDSAMAHEVMLCIQTQTVMSDPKRMRYGPSEFYLKSAAEMAATFPDRPDALANTLLIAEQCNLEIEFNKPHFPVYGVEAGKTQAGYLEELCARGLREKYGVEDLLHPRNDEERRVIERFRMELGVIGQTGFVNYFLVVWDFVDYAKRSRIPVGPGRGSGAGSLVAYILGITDIDPLQYGLIFERFLNPERVSAPDFDIDFCPTRRGEVIDYVKRKYGRENVAQIVTFGSMGAKTVIRDVGRALEVPLTESDRLAKLVPDDPKINLRKALEAVPALRSEYENNPLSRRLIDYGFQLEGLSRNIGTHAAGVVIGEKPLIEIIPLARDKDGEPITQYTMEPLNELGLLKMDFLGLKTLTVIQETVDLVRELHGLAIDIGKLPVDDAPAYDLLRRGDTVGVFQLESSGMRDLARRVDVNSIAHLCAMIALYRPGPMDMIDAYVDRRLGRKPVEYDHPLLEPILRETYGVMIYQEQVQQAANLLAGYSLAQGDMLRRAMGKKKPEEMAKYRASFVEGCERLNGIPSDVAARIFDRLEEFAGYGFNKSHSAAYAVVCYQTAYLKANYPAEFMAALLSSEIGNSEKLIVFIQEVRDMGLQVLPPDVNRSHVRFRPEGRGVRFGLAGIKTVGEGAAAAIVRTRAESGDFRGLLDFCLRLDGQEVNKKVVEGLVRCGAFDACGMHRARLLNGIDFAMQRSQAVHRDRVRGQASLFELMGEDAAAAPREDEIPDCEPMHESEQLAAEKELLGLFMSGHPLSKFTVVLSRYPLHRVAQLAEIEERTATRVGGIITQVSNVYTKKQEAMAVLQVEGLDGSFGVTVFPAAYRMYQALLVVDTPVLICGEISRQRENEIRVLANEIHPLAEVPRLFTRYISLHVPVARADAPTLRRLHAILQLHPGAVRVVICLLYPQGQKVYVQTGTDLNVMPSEDLEQEIEQVLGEKSVYVAVTKQACLSPPPPRRVFQRTA